VTISVIRLSDGFHERFLLSGVPGAEAADEAGVTESVEILRKGLLEADRTKLAQVTSAQISYGHSDGRVETKEQFIHAVMTRPQVVKSLAFPELKVAVVGDAAIARHISLAESERDGKDRRPADLAEAERSLEATRATGIQVGGLSSTRNGAAREGAAP
jgi:hypothetical protein